jgi:hypothetical protein
MLLRCGSKMMGGTAAAMGGLAMLAATGPFLAGIGVGAGVVGAALAARQVMRRRSAWREDAAGTGAEPMMPDEGEPRPAT